MKIGDRIGAILSASNETVNLLGYGVYAGEEEPPNFFMKNPKLQLDNGKVVWGYQCWWGSEEKVKTIIGTRAVVEVTITDED